MAALDAAGVKGKFAARCHVVLTSLAMRPSQFDSLESAEFQGIKLRGNLVAHSLLAIEQYSDH